MLLHGTNLRQLRHDRQISLVRLTANKQALQIAPNNADVKSWSDQGTRIVDSLKLREKKVEVM
jgi:hypothetical protein